MSIQRIAQVLEAASAGEALRVQGLLDSSLQASGIGEGTIVGAINIAPATPTLIKAKATQLEGRTSVFIVNESLNDIYIGFDNTVSLEEGIPIYSGTERIFTMNPLNGTPIYAYSELETKIIVCEVK